MSQASSLIDPVRLQALLGDANARFHLELLAECPSTNTRLLGPDYADAPGGSVVVADRQTAGRGSRGRRWFASPEASLTFSLLWRFSGGLEKLSGLSLAVGLAVVEAIDACGGAQAAERVKLKWPNDIVHRGAKLGGILVELQATEHEAVAVIGIGLNLRLPDNIAADETMALAPTALDRVAAVPPAREALLAAILTALAAILDRFGEDGFAALRDAWQARNAWQDKPVRLLREGRVEVEGVCRGADADGALLVQTPAGTQRCLSGDLSLRAP